MAHRTVLERDGRVAGDLQAIVLDAGAHDHLHEIHQHAVGVETAIIRKRPNPSEEAVLVGDGG